MVVNHSKRRPLAESKTAKGVMGESELKKKVNVANHYRHQFLLCAPPLPPTRGSKYFLSSFLFPR